MRAISHIINYFASFLYQRFGKVGIFPGLLESFPLLILNLLFFFNFYFFHVENLANFFLLLNRLTSVLFLMKYAKIWRYAMPFAILFTFLFPLSITSHIFKLDMFISYSDNNYTFTLNYSYPAYYKQWPIVWRKGNVFLAMVSALSFMVICLAINLATILVMKRKTRNVSKMNPDRTRTEHRMTVYALVTFLGQFIMALYMIVQYVIASIIKHDDRIDEDFRLEMISATQNQFGWVNDLCTVALPAWLLLWVSPTFRQTLLCVMNPLLNLMCRYIRHWIYGTNGNHQQRNTNKPKAMCQQEGNVMSLIPMREFNNARRGARPFRGLSEPPISSARRPSNSTFWTEKLQQTKSKSTISGWHSSSIGAALQPRALANTMKISSIEPRRSAWT